MNDAFHDFAFEPTYLFGFAITTFFGVRQNSYIAISDGSNVCYYAGPDDITIIPLEHIEFFHDDERKRMIPEYDETIQRLIDYYNRWSSWSVV